MTIEEFESNDEGRQWQYPKPVPLQASRITKIKISTPLAEQHAWLYEEFQQRDRKKREMERWKVKIIMTEVKNAFTKLSGKQHSWGKNLWTWT